MMQRRINYENNSFNYIIPNSLDLSKYKEEKEQLISLSGEDKLLFITTYLENNLEVQDIFSNLFYSNENKQMNDLIKYYLIYCLSLLNKDVMKKSFPGAQIKNNNIIIGKENPLFMSKKLFQIFFSLLANSEKDVQFTVLELLLNYSDMSYDCIDYYLEDTRYIDKIFNLTYNNNNSIIISSLIILDNILISKDCDQEQLEKLIQQLPIIQRCKELLCDNKFNNDIKINCLEILETISGKVNEEFFRNYFLDLLKVFYNLISLQPKNEEIIMIIFKICSRISNDDDISIQLKNIGLAFLFFQYLSVPNLERDFLIELLKIFSNLFYSDENITFFMNDKNGEIIKVFISIINTYLHSSNEKDNSIFTELFFCLSNLAAGPDDTKYILSKSEIPSLIMQVMKKKNNNNIFFEGIHFFNNIIENSNKETFYNISELHPFKLYAQGLKETLDNKNLELCLNAIINLISKNREIYHTIENLKNNFHTSCIRKKIDDLTLHKNELISEKAKNILNIFEDRMNME